MIQVDADFLLSLSKSLYSLAGRLAAVKDFMRRGEYVQAYALIDRCQKETNPYTMAAALRSLIDVQSVMEMKPNGRSDKEA